MRKIQMAVVFAVVLAFVLTAAALAAPALEITKPPVAPVPSWTGPVIDPNAVDGQWFLKDTETYRTHEFYDNVDGYGGGHDYKTLVNPYNTQQSKLQDWGSHWAIYGKASNVSLDINNNITSFNIVAAITNDLPGIGWWANGANSHGETLSTNQSYVGTLYGARLTAEFALTSLNNVPSSWTSPYNDRQPYIVATNEDLAAWYCWTPGNPEQLTPAGGYYVPTWELGNIAQGETVFKTLQFSVVGGMNAADSRYGKILASQAADWGDGDLFLNRTTDLKIGDWLDGIGPDDGSPYPQTDALRSGNVSVFFAIPEPGSLAALGCGGFGLLMMALRRRK